MVFVALALPARRKQSAPEQSSRQRWWQQCCRNPAAPHHGGVSWGQAKKVIDTKLEVFANSVLESNIIIAVLAK